MSLEADMKEPGIPAAPSLPVTRGSISDHAFKGFVDLFGYHCLAGGWFFAGWAMHRDDLAERLQHAVAEFEDTTVSARVSSLFFSRDDISSQAVGFLIFVRAGVASTQAFTRLRIELDGGAHSIYPVDEAYMLPEAKLVPRLKFIVSLGEESLQRREMELLLDGHPEAIGHGYIEYFGFHPTAGGWIASGWLSRGWSSQQSPDRVVMSFEDGDIRGDTVASLFERPELPDGAQGVMLFVRAGAAAFGQLSSVSMHVGGVRSTLVPITAAPRLREAELTDRVRDNLLSARPGLLRDRLTNLVTRRSYVGEDTLEAFAPAIFLYIDEAIVCGLDGLVLMGWMLAKPDEIREIRLCSGSKRTALRLRDAVKIERHDVLEGFAQYGYEEANSGFVIYVPASFEPEGQLYIEVETHRFETGFRNIARPARTGMAAIKKLLGTVDVKFADMRHAFDRVLGPAVEALNRTRLLAATAEQVLEYGAVPAAPAFSVIVPLFGRLDFVEYQMALFSARPQSANVEFIYVLDDPPKRREAQLLFASVFERFQIPFRAILLDRNLGFAPANNVGLRHAHGEFIAYLNSDVFPDTPDWLEQLAGQLIDDPKIGVVAPLLLFEDGSIQHRGMYFERLPEYGGWFFCQHHDKGLRYKGGGDPQAFIAVTGACMVMRRDLANQIGGFDETYVIGDFEDSDLCLKLQALGYQCVVDPAVRLYHLERKSQHNAGQTWRSNLTAYNAWQHERRWSETIAEKQTFAFGGRP
jgi:GT2 family glycosyltransferase